MSDDVTTVVLLEPPWYDHMLLMPTHDYPAMHLMWEPLVAWEDGQYVPRLARSWEVAEDGRTWTYHLRTDVRWHDGVPFTARDIEFTIQLLSHPEVLRLPPGAIDVTASDDSTVTLRYRRHPGSYAPLDTYEVFLPRHLLKDLDPAGFRQQTWDFFEHPVGNGPFRWVRREPNIMVELEANPDYYRGRPDIDRLIVKLASDPVAELKAGNVDVAGFATLSAEMLPTLESDPGIRVYWQPSHTLSAIYLNHRHPALGDPLVRRAITLAIDRRTWQRLRGVPAEAPFFDVPLEEAQVLSGDYPDALPHDPRRASGLLERAGWKDSDGDGIRDRDNERLAFTVLAPARTLEGTARTLVFVQSALERVGIRMEIETLQNNAVAARVAAGKFDAYGPTDTARGRLWARLLGDSASTGSPLGYTSQRLSALVEELRSELVPDERARIRREMWPIFQNDLPVLFLGPRVWFSAAHERVKGLESPSRVWPEPLMAGLRIEQ